MLRIKWMAASGVAIGVIAAGGVAYATIPGPDGAISGCYTKTAGLFDAKGTVRVVDSTSECRSSELALTWNQEGQPGQDGADGDPGPQGPAGPAGPVATTNVYFASHPSTIEFRDPQDMAPKTIVSMELAAGSYVLQARVNVRAFTEAIIGVECSIPGAANTQWLGRSPGYEQGHQTDLTSAISHPGGAIALICRRVSTGAIVLANSATLLATKVDSVG